MNRLPCNKLWLALFFWLTSYSIAYSEVNLMQLDGQTISFKELQGKWVLINYWASWCQPCLDEISELNRFFKQHKQRVALFAVNYDALPIDEQLALSKQFAISYPSLKDPSRALGLGSIHAVPATFVFTPKGQLKTTLYGGQTYASIMEAIGH